MSRPPTAIRRPAASRPRRRMLVIAPAVAAVLALATACGEQAATPAAGGVPPAAQTGATAPFTATTADGNKVTVPGGKPAVVYFFSASCGSCIEGARAVAQAQKDAPTAADYVAVGLDPGSTDADIRSFLTSADATALAGTPDGQGELMRAYRVQAVSTAIVLNPAGQVVYTGIKPPASEITAAVQKVGRS